MYATFALGETISPINALKGFALIVTNLVTLIGIANILERRNVIDVKKLGICAMIVEQ